MLGAVAARRWLLHPRAWVWVPLAGSVLALTALGPHLVFDDYVLGLQARAWPIISGLKQGGLDLFTFTTGVTADNRALMDQGMLLPWWTDETLKVAFFRPLSSMLHRLDYLLWPGVPQLMHLHSLAWLTLMLGAAAHCYRRLESSPLLAGLATLLLAVDDTHAPSVAWLSNRNALVAAAFGLLALATHDRARRERHRPSAVLGPCCFLLALAAGEFGLATAAYLIAHALWLDPAPPLSRLRALAPYGAVLALWSGGYALSGAAVHGSGSYVSPLSEPLRFLQQLPARADCLLAAAVSPLPSDLLFLGRPEHAPIWIALAALVLGVTCYALWPHLLRDRVARFWCSGAVLSVVPIAASFPSDRLLLFVSFGAMGLVARITAPLFEAPRPPPRLRQLLAGVFAAFHLGLGPLLLPLRAAQMQVTGHALAHANAAWSEVPQLDQRTVIIVNAPVVVFASYLQAERAWQQAPRPRHLYWLTSAGSRLSVTRTGPSSLTVEREGGFLSTPLEQHYRGHVDSRPPSFKVELTEMTAEVRRVTEDGRPLSVEFRFQHALESPAYLFLAWQDDRYDPVALPEMGQTLHFPAEDWGAISLRAALASAAGPRR